MYSGAGFTGKHVIRDQMEKQSADIKNASFHRTSIGFSVRKSYESLPRVEQRDKEAAIIVPDGSKRAKIDI